MNVNSSGYIPNNILNLYSGSSRKLDQTDAVQGKKEAEDVGKSTGSGTSNIDTIQFSQIQVKYTSLSKARDQVLTDINKDKDISFLNMLKAQINSNQYKIDPKQMAKIMLDRD
jgi:anti-sigma28 factor (negative regulator of flagellin synthesis)